MRRRWAIGLAAFASACGRISFDPNTLDAGLVAHWTFDTDPQTGTIADVTGHGHTLTCFGSRCGASIEGRIGNEIRRDATHTPGRMLVLDNAAPTLAK